LSSISTVPREEGVARTQPGSANILNCRRAIDTYASDRATPSARWCTHELDRFPTVRGGIVAVMPAVVLAVHLSATHSFSKRDVDRIRVIEGLGVEGDAHCGATVQHLSRVRTDPSQPNLRQIHLIHGELFDDLSSAGYVVAPGQLGENVTTRGIDLLALPVGTRLHIASAVITVTGLRNPCQQINDFHPGLLKEVLCSEANGVVTRLAGVMGTIARGGLIAPGDRIEIELPPPPHLPLTRV